MVTLNVVFSVTYAITIFIIFCIICCLATNLAQIGCLDIIEHSNPLLGKALHQISERHSIAELQVVSDNEYNI